MLQIKNLTITHKKDLRPLLEDFNFTLNTGDRAVIISEEGNGKSTLLKLAAGFLCPDYGEICFQDMPVWENREFHMNDYQGAGKELFEKEVLAEMKGDVL